MRRFALLLLGLLVVLVSWGCANRPNIEDAPLAEDRRAKLEKTLAGKWRATHRAPEGGTREPIEGKTPMWTFRSDGTGTFGEGVGSASEASEEFEWRLEGRNLMLTFASDRPTQYYRTETWSPAQMRWWNYREEEFLILRGVDVEEQRRGGDSPDGTNDPRRRRPDREEPEPRRRR